MILTISSIADFIFRSSPYSAFAIALKYLSFSCTTTSLLLISAINNKFETSCSVGVFSRYFSTRFLVFDILPDSARCLISTFSISARCSISPFSAEILRRIKAAFSSWRTRSRVMSRRSPICSSVSFAPLSPKRRVIISCSRGCPIIWRDLWTRASISWIFSFWIWLLFSILSLFG